MATIPALRSTARCLEISVAGFPIFCAISTTMSESPVASSRKIAQRNRSPSPCARGVSGKPGALGVVDGETGEGVRESGISGDATHFYRNVIELGKNEIEFRRSLMRLSNTTKDSLRNY